MDYKYSERNLKLIGLIRERGEFLQINDDLEIISFLEVTYRRIIGEKLLKENTEKFNAFLKKLYLESVPEVLDSKIDEEQTELIKKRIEESKIGLERLKKAYEGDLTLKMINNCLKKIEDELLETVAKRLKENIPVISDLEISH